MSKAAKRIGKEISKDKVLENLPPGVHSVEVDDANVLNWSGLIAPVSEPYSAGAFKFTLTFPADYPFRAPKFKMQTPIYHPNFNEQGEVCLGLLNEWKPATKIGDVLTALVHLIHAPEPDHPLRAELAEQFQQDRAKFDAEAKKLAAESGEPRPA